MVKMLLSMSMVLMILGCGVNTASGETQSLPYKDYTPESLGLKKVCIDGILYYLRPGTVTLTPVYWSARSDGWTTAAVYACNKERSSRP